VSIRDENGCKIELTGITRPAQIPIISLPEKIFAELGDSLALSAVLNDIKVKNQTWSPPNTSCNTCLTTEIFPLQSQLYNFRVESADGCIREASTEIVIERKGYVFYPNIFRADHSSSPFQITGGKDVRTIIRLSIYDRWGNLIFVNANASFW